MFKVKIGLYMANVHGKYTANAGQVISLLGVPFGVSYGMCLSFIIYKHILTLLYVFRVGHHFNTRKIIILWSP